jgi:PAS domain S-box-containing protein
MVQELAKRKPRNEIPDSKRAEEVLRASEGPYWVLFERNPQPMWVYDVQTLTFLAVNQAAVELYGYSREEFLRMTIRDIRPAEDLPAFHESLSDDVLEFEEAGACRHRKKDGTLFDVEITSHNLDWAGRSVRVVSARDFTGSKQAEERLRQSEESYRRLVEHSPDAMLVHRQGTMIFANSACVEMFGASSADELLGRQHLDFVHPDDREIVKQRMQKFSYDLESVRRNETKYLRLDGKETYAEVVARSVIYQGEVAIQIMFRDISQRKQTEEKLRQSEANLAAAQAMAHVGNWSWDINGDVVSWSGEMYRMYGVSPEKFDLNVSALARSIRADDVGRYEKCITDMLAGKPVDGFEYHIVRPDGSERVVQMLGGAVGRDVQGAPVRISGVVLDITERKRAEERFSKAFNATPDPIIIATASEGRYIDVNESFLRVTGYRREEVVGRTSADIGFFERLEDRDMLMETLKKQGSVRNFEITFLTKSGEPRTGLDSAEIIEVDGQKCILAIFKDITEQKILEKQRQRAEDALARRADELARSNAELEQFAYVASHDLQEPLRMVASYTQLLANRYQDKLDDDARDFIAYAVDGATRMQTLIADLLNYSRVGTRGKPFQPANCEAILERVLASLKLAMSENGATVSHDLLPAVMGDDMQLSQLFQNLLANAIKFHGEGPPVIHVSAERNGNAWTFSIRDNGIGIAPEHAERIFLIFQRLHSRNEYSGTGIGLAVCKKIVERHGGRIWVSSQPGSGATFFFTIPDGATSAQEEHN